MSGKTRQLGAQPPIRIPCFTTTPGYSAHYLRRKKSFAGFCSSSAGIGILKSLPHASCCFFTRDQHGGRAEPHLPVDKQQAFI